MKNFSVFWKKLSIAVLFLAALLCFATLFPFASFRAYGDEVLEKSLYLPKSGIEYKSLTSPVDAEFFGDGKEFAAVIENNGNTLYAFGENGWEKKIDGTYNFKQVRQYDSGHLIISLGSFYTVSLDDFSLSPLYFDDMLIEVNNFDINDDYLVAQYSVNCIICKRENGVIVSKRQVSGIDSESPVSINDDNEVFCVSGGKLCRFSAEDEKFEKTVISDEAPVTMAADTGYIYYSKNRTDVYRMTVDGEEITSLVASSVFDLGKVVKIKSLKLYCGKLIVTDDGIPAVSEFDVENNNLSFTGFAIAKEKTAFNRIGSGDNKKIEKLNDAVAVLDDLKVTYVKQTADGEEFFNILFTGATPYSFSMGEKSLLFTNGANGYCFKPINFEEAVENFTPEYTELGYITDLSYQSGYYYISTKAGGKANVYKLKEEAGATPVIILENLNATEAALPAVAADVFGNLIFTDYSTDSLLKYKCIDEYDYQKDEPSFVGALTSTVKKLSTDIVGGVFALRTGAVDCYVSGVKTTYTADATVSSVSFSFADRLVLLVCNGDEKIYSSLSLNNRALSEIKKTEDYRISGKTTDIAALTLYKCKDGANAYRFNATADGFSYLLRETRAEDVFVFVCSYNLGGSTFAVTEGRDGDGNLFTYIFDTSLLTDVTEATVKTETAGSVFVATDVSAYYLPIISMDDRYTLKDDGTVRLSKKTELNYLGKKFDIEGRTFLYVSFTKGETEYKGYVPAAFTVDTLSEDVISGKYRYGKVSATDVFSDDNLTVKVTTLGEDGEIRIFGIENGVAKIAYKDGENWTKGDFYISANAVKEEPDTVIRNSLIILALALSLSATLIFFILRKKNGD